MDEWNYFLLMWGTTFCGCGELFLWMCGTTFCGCGELFLVDVALFFVDVGN